MTVADILDGAFRTWRSVAGTAVVLVSLVMGPFELLQNLVLYRSLGDVANADGFLVAPGELDVGLVGLTFLLASVSVVVWVVAASAVVTLVDRADRGEDVRVGVVLRAGVRPAFVALAGVIVIGLVGFVLLVVAVLVAAIPILGAVFLAVTAPVALGAAAALVALVVPIAVTEGRGPIATLGRALWVLRTRFWRTIGITWLMLIVLVGVSLGLAVVLDLLSGLAGPADWAVLAISGVLVSIVQVPVLSYAALLVFLDARIVREAYDLDVRVARVAEARAVGVVR